MMESDPEMAEESETIISDGKHIEKSSENTGMFGSKLNAAGDKSKWESNMNSDPQSLAVECAHHLYFGNWELFRGLTTTLIYQDCEPYGRNYVLHLLRSIFDQPHVYCKGSTTIEKPQQLYWLCAQFYVDICGNKDEADRLTSDADFRLLLSELHNDQDKNTLAEIYGIATSDPDSSLSDECQRYLTDLLSSNTELACAILSTIFRSDQSVSNTRSHHRFELLQSLHQSLDECLTKLDLHSGSTFHSNGPNGKSATTSSIYRLLLLGGVLACPRILPADYNGDCSREQDTVSTVSSPSSSAPSPLALHEDQNHRLVSRLLEFCERGILDKNIVFSLCLSHGGDLQFVHALCHLEDQRRHRVEVDDAAMSAANFLHLVRDRSGRLDVRQMFLHSVTNSTHFLEKIVVSCVELISRGDSLLAHCTLQDQLMCRLKPLVLLVMWTRVKSISGVIRFLDSHDLLMGGEPLLSSRSDLDYTLATAVDARRSDSSSPSDLNLTTSTARYVLACMTDSANRSDLDLTLVSACDELARKARLVLRTISNNEWSGRSKRTKVQHQNVLDLLPSLSKMSALYVLSRCASIGCVPRDQAFELLKLCAPSSGDKNRTGCLIGIADDAVLLSYYAMCDFARAVEDGITVDHMIEESRRRFRRVVSDDVGVTSRLQPTVVEDCSSGTTKVDEWKLFYEIQVIGRLESARADVSNIYPLDYRVEILENAFGLLFATHRHVREGSVDLGGESSANSDDGHEGADESTMAAPVSRRGIQRTALRDLSHGSQKVETICKSGLSLATHHRRYLHLHHHHPLAKLPRDDKDDVEVTSTKDEKESTVNIGIKKSRSPKRRFVAAVVPTDAATTATHQHHQPPSSECNSSPRNSSTRSTSSGGRGLSCIGFVANAFIVRDLLECIKRCADDAVSLHLAAAKRDEADGARSIQRRLSRLSQFVSEAQWRFQLVADESTPKSYSQLPSRPLRRSFDAGPANDCFWNFYFHDAESDDDSFATTSSKSTRKTSLATATQSAGRIRTSDQTGIINRMLAPHDSLLNMCLHQNQFVKAGEVIKVFGMEKTAKASEIEFAMAYQRTLQLLLKSTSSSLTIGTRSTRSPSALSPSLAPQRSPWESILDAAQSGAEAATAADSLSIDELLAAHQVPSIAEWESAVKLGGDSQSSLTKPAGLPERVDWRSLVKADLAVVGCGRPDVARSVLESCHGALRGGSGIATSSSISSSSSAKVATGTWRGRLSRQKSTTTTSKGLLGYLDNVHQLSTCLSEMGVPDSECHWPQPLRTMSVRSLLLQATWPLSIRQFKVATNTWKRLGSALEQFRSFLRKEETAVAALTIVTTQSRSAGASLSSSPVTATGSPRQLSDVVVPSNDRHPIHAVYHKLQRFTTVARLMLAEEEAGDSSTLSDRHGTISVDRIPAYMLTLYEYAKNVHGFLPQFNQSVDHGYPTTGSYFSVFAQSPATILKQLLFDTSVTPSELEQFAKHLNLNLLQIVVQHSSPYVSAIGFCSTKQSGDYLSDSNQRSDSLGSQGSSSNKSKEETTSPVRPHRLSVGSLGSCELESSSMSPVLLEYVRKRCWLAALVMQELGCCSAGNKSSDLSSNKTASTSESDDVGLVIDQHNIIFHPTLHRFLQYRRSGAHNQHVKHAAQFPFLPSVPAAHVAATLDEFVCSEDWLGLVEFVDSWECQRVGDSLASLVATRRDEAFVNLAQSNIGSETAATTTTINLEPPWVYVLRVRDCRRRWDVVLKHHTDWDDEGAVAALSACAFDCALEEEWRNEARLFLDRVRLYRDIVSAVDAGDIVWFDTSAMASLNWQDVSRISESDPASLLRCLAGWRRHELIVRWSEVHTVDDAELRSFCNESAVLFLIEAADTDPASVQRVLEDTVDIQQQFSICLKMLDYLCEHPKRASMLLAVVDSFDLAGIDEERAKMFSRKKIGLKILLCLDEDERSDYLRLVTRPHLMIEQLLMHFKIETMQLVYHNIRDGLRAFVQDEWLSYEALDRLAEVYASKSIDFRIGRDSSSSGHQLLQQQPDSVSRTSSTDLTQTAGSKGDTRPFVLPTIVPTRQQWVPDDASSHCAVCQLERFTMFNRRHHCRRCGRVVCATCSQRKSLVSGYADVMVRVCDDCYLAASNDARRESLASSSENFPSSSDTLDQRLDSHFASTGRPLANAIKRRHESFRQTTCRLTLDETHNATLRQEFSYEHAPNISLCLSILDLHWDQRKSADYLMQLAETLFAFLQPVAPGVANAEVDYTLVISLLRTVFLSSRVKFSRLPDNDRDAVAVYCDLCLSLTDLLQLLVKANCKHLIPVGDYTNTKAVSQSLLRLRDRLMKEERWDLALEVSTKGGLNVSGVWTAWGMTSLKVGAYETARKKFARCLLTPVDRNKPAPSGTLLGQILQRLERVQCIVGVVVTAETVLRFRQRLEAIKSGNVQNAQQTTAEPSKTGGRKVTTEIRAECLHYVRTYGTHETALAFHLRHEDYDEALRYLVEHKCPPATFVDHLALPSMRHGCWHRVLDAATLLDRSLDSLAAPFGAFCRHLERAGSLHSLYGVQVFAGDHVRAAGTCIQFYRRDARDYSDLYDRLPHLVNARHHLQTYRQSGSCSKKLVMHVTLPETDRYLRSIALQDEVTKFLQGKSAFWHDTFASGSAASDAGSMTSFSMSSDNLIASKDACSVPTVFEDPKSRANVVSLVLLMGSSVAEGFDLAVSIIREYRLRAPNVFSLVAKRLLLQQRAPEVSQLIVSMKEVAGQSDETCDQVLLRAISLAVSQRCDNKELDIFIKLLANESNRIEAQIQCGKLKSAYLLAVKRDSSDYIQRIMNEADRTGQTSVKTICEKWISRKQNA